MPIIIWNLYKILNINCIIGIDTSLTYISGSLTFLGTLGVTLSSLYSSKKADLDKILDKNKILITEGRIKRLSLFADEENTLALSFYIYSLTFPDEIIIKELSIYNPQKTEKKCVITNDQNNLLAFIYPQFDGHALFSVFLDGTTPPIAHILINNNNELAINISFDMIKNNVITPTLYCADIKKLNYPKGMYTHRLIHPTFISIDEPYFCK